MKSANKKIIIAIILIIFTLLLISVYVKILARFDYQDHLDDTVISVDGECVTLREFGYYIYEVEDFVQNQALLYDSENPKLWWNTHFSAGADSQFVCEYAKKVALEVCTCDQIYYKEAIASGFILDAAAETQNRVESRELFMEMDPSQIEATGLNEEIIDKIYRKHMIASKYAETLSKRQDFISYGKKTEEVLNWDGEYYREKILPKHEVELNDKILDEIILGRITVNRED